jgi:hypothetical protein
MKPSIDTRKDKGSILVTALLTIVVLMISLGAYLGMTAYQVRSANRSECWNMAIAVAEAGIEEGHAHLNQNGLSNLFSNGWVATGTNTAVKTRQLGSNSFTVTILSNRLARIVSVGSVWVPGSNGSNLVSRTVEVTAKNPGILDNSLLLLNSVDGSGGNAYIDSFSSTNGPYTLATRRDHGDVQCLGNSAGCVALGNTDVLGKISTTPGGSVTVGGGAVGDTNWVATQTGIEPGWVNNNMDPFVVPNAPIPAFNGFPAGNGKYNGTNYDILLQTGQYYISNLKLAGTKTMLVAGDAQLRVTSSIDIAGQASILIKSNASLTIYMDGQSAKIAGQGIINYNQLV